jgi:hypothetical protein
LGRFGSLSLWETEAVRLRRQIGRTQLLNPVQIVLRARGRIAARYMAIRELAFVRNALRPNGGAFVASVSLSDRIKTRGQLLRRVPDFLYQILHVHQVVVAFGPLGNPFMLDQ